MANRRSLQQEINDLKSRLGQLTVRSGRGAPGSRNSQNARRRIGNRAARNANNANNNNSSNNTIPAAVSGSSRSGARISNSAGGLGVVSLRARELVATIELPSGKTETGGSVVLLATPIKSFSSVPAQLSKLGSLYEQIKWISAEFEYEPLCGTTTNGGIILGVEPMDARTKTATVDAAYVSALQPNVQGPLYQKHRVKIPANVLNARPWYAIGDKAVEQSVDVSPGAVVHHITADSNTTTKVYGRLWLHYDVRLQGFAVNAS